MDESEMLRTKQLVWELVSPLMDRLDRLNLEVSQLRQRVGACEAELKQLREGEEATRRPPAALPPPERMKEA